LTHKNQPTSNIQIDLQKTHSLLDTELKEIADFAFQQKLFDWSNTFKKARIVLSNDSPDKEYYHKDLIVEKNYSLTAHQILFAAGSAWVFGGMGSWNDIGFETKEDNKKYEDLSAKLFNAINQSILAATNSY
jgi:hypothetical protein